MTMYRASLLRFALTALAFAALAPAAHAAAMTTTNKAALASTGCTGTYVAALPSLDTAYLPSDYATPGKYCFQTTQVTTFDCSGNLTGTTYSYAEYSGSSIAANSGGTTNTCGTGGSLLLNYTSALFGAEVAHAEELLALAGSKKTSHYSTVTYVAPSVSLTGGTSIVSGNSALLSWSSNMYNSSNGLTYGSCSGVGTGSSGSVKVSPTTTTTYTETCTLTGGSSAASSQTVYVYPPLTNSTVSCSVSPVNTTIGSTVTWSGQTTGGQPPYTYTFTGDNFSGTASAATNSTTYSQTNSYNSGGTKTAQLSVTDSSGSSPAYSYSVAANDQCTGAFVQSQQDVEDGGTFNPRLAIMFANIMLYAQTNPQNYCVTAEAVEYCNPNGTEFGTGTCPIYYTTSLYSGTSDSAATIPTNDYAYYIAAVHGQYSGTPNATGSAACSNSVTVDNRPNAPTLSCPSSVNVGATATITANASDPDGNYIRYGFSPANSQSVAAWVPSSGYVPSGTSESYGYSWSTPGTYTVYVLAQDSPGENSAWSSCTVNVPTPANGACGSANGRTYPYGSSSYSPYTQCS